MELHLWLSLVTICFLGALSPGPSLALVVNNTLKGEVSQGYATAISHGIGVGIYAALTVAGIGIIIVNSPVLYGFIQYAGAAFLLYLGFKALTSKKSNQLDTSLPTEEPLQINGWRDGFLIAFLNPKLAIFFLALFSQFVDAQATLKQQFIMASTVSVIDTLWYCFVVFGVSRGPVVKRLKANQHIVDRITGGFLIILAARVVWV